VNLEKGWKEFLNKLSAFKWATDPFVSLLTDNCSSSCKDISEGGAKYNNYGVTTIGLNNTVDSLLYLKKNAFDGKESYSRLIKARNKNYKKYESIITDINNNCHFFGRDEEEVVELTNIIIEQSNNAVKDFKNSFDGMIKFGLSSPNYIKGAKKSGADFSGRKNGDPYSTHISNNLCAYTELVMFASKLSYQGNCVNGNVIDYFISPSILKQDKDKFINFILLSTKAGFYQMQMNILDSKTLIDAKKYPEKYPGLIVRVWGFSAYFVDLPGDYQDLLIKRALENEKGAACLLH